MQAISEINTASANQMKIMTAQTQEIVRKSTDRGKYMANFAKNPDNVNGKTLISEDVQRLEDHRQNFMDFLYVQIEEHS